MDTSYYLFAFLESIAWGFNVIYRKIITFLLIINFANSFANATDSKQFKFSALELEMDHIANKYAGDTSAVLDALDDLLKNTPNATPGEKALFMTYDCALRAGLASTLAEQRLVSLKEYSREHTDNAAVRAATALCEANVANYLKDTPLYRTSLYKAFLFTQNADVATLRYWISLNVSNLFEQLHDVQNNEKALLIGLQVANDNQDLHRIQTANHLLADLYLASKQYQLALKHNEASQQALEQTKDTWYQAELFSNKAKALQALAQYQSSEEFFQKAISQSKKAGKHRDTQFFVLDLAFLSLLKNDLVAANSLIASVELYAAEYNDKFLQHQVLLLQSFYALVSNDSDQANTLFAQAINFLVKGDYEASILQAWQKHILIAQKAKQFERENEAQAQYRLIFEKYIRENSLNVQTILEKVLASIRQDDADIAQYHLEQATTQTAQISKNREVLLLGVLLLAALLAIILVKFAWSMVIRYKLNQAEINRQLFYDPLTQCFNRRYFNDVISKNLVTASLAKKTSFLVAIDIDHFKKFNDVYGHSAGDTVLKELVKSLQDDSRLSDNVVRLGGEEFLIVLPPNDNLRIEVVIERILSLVSNSPVVIEDKPRDITISIGYVPVEKANSKGDIDDLLNLADKALYLAKEKGRNRAFGVSELQCPANYIDKITIASENKLLKLTEIEPKKDL